MGLLEVKFAERAAELEAAKKASEQRAAEEAVKQRHTETWARVTDLSKQRDRLQAVLTQLQELYGHDEKKQVDSNNGTEPKVERIPGTAEVSVQSVKESKTAIEKKVNENREAAASVIREFGVEVEPPDDLVTGMIKVDRKLDEPDRDKDVQAYHQAAAETKDIIGGVKGTDGQRSGGLRELQQRAVAEMAAYDQMREQERKASVEATGETYTPIVTKNINFRAQRAKYEDAPGLENEPGPRETALARMETAIKSLDEEIETLKAQTPEGQKVLRDKTRQNVLLRRTELGGAATNPDEMDRHAFVFAGDLDDSTDLGPEEVRGIIQKDADRQIDEAVARETAAAKTPEEKANLEKRAQAAKELAAAKIDRDFSQLTLNKFLLEHPNAETVANQAVNLKVRQKEVESMLAQEERQDSQGKTYGKSQIDRLLEALKPYRDLELSVGSTADGKYRIEFTDDNDDIKTEVHRLKQEIQDHQRQLDREKPKRRFFGLGPKKPIEQEPGFGGLIERQDTKKALSRIRDRSIAAGERLTQLQSRQARAKEAERKIGRRHHALDAGDAYKHLLGKKLKAWDLYGELRMAYREIQDERRPEADLELLRQYEPLEQAAREKQAAYETKKEELKRAEAA